MKLGILFSGQGSQRPNMGYDLYKGSEKVREFYDSLKLDYDIRDISFGADENTLKHTIYTQPVLVAFHIAVLELLKEMGVKYDYIAGLSLGEFSALTAAEVLTASEVMEIIEDRSKFMSDCCKKEPSTLIALLGLDEDEIEKYILDLRNRGIFIEIANLNCPKQVVVGIKRENLQEITDYFSNIQKLRIVPLEVEGAFHTSIMDDAAVKLVQKLSKYEFKEEKTPIVFNRTGDFRNGESYIKLLSEQANHTTYFEKSLRKMINMGTNTFLEIGFNDIFKGFIKRIDRSVKVIPLNTLESIERLDKEFII